MDPEGFELRRRLEGRTSAQAAFEEVLATARRSVRLFDDTGELWGLERKEVADALRRLLRTRPDAQAVFVLLDPAPLQARAVRLVELLSSFAPRLQVLRAGEPLKVVGRGFVLIDDAAVMRRPSFAQPLAYLDHDDASIASAASLFEEIVAQSEPGIASRVTGL